MNVSGERVVVIGGGAAGMMAAGTAASAGAAVTLIDKNEKLGKKLYITGKGRCNVTNNCTAEEVRRNVPTNSRFLFSCLDNFTPADTISFFEGLGCPLKTERGNRVFPETDRSASVLDALKKYLRQTGVHVTFGTVREILTRDGCICGVRTTEQTVECERVILATGGCSYPLTGSTGDGYAMAAALGHTVVEPVGSLVPLVERGHDCQKMQGLSLRNVHVRLFNGSGKMVFDEFGELLFTHFGLSGPTILSASAHMKRGEDGYKVSIDLKPALDEQLLDLRLLRDFEKYQNRDFSNALDDLLPKSVIPVIIQRSAIPPETKTNSVTRLQRRELLHIIKSFDVEIACKAPVEDAIITSGGIKVSEINPKTMESKLVPGLYFAGELIDVDAYTGGFNLQIAWSTGHAAGLASAENNQEG